MAKYLLIESRDPFDSNDVAHFGDVAKGLAHAGNQVTLFLVQNGVLAARAGARCEGVRTVAEAGVRVLADEFSLRERGITADRLATHVKPSPLDVVIDHLAEGAKALWH
jgi:predicted peroxiredoxin